MSQDAIDASPTKSFFIENLTRDLTLEDAVLDLVDNSIDASLQVQQFDLSPDVLWEPPSSDGSRSQVDIEVDASRVMIEDDASGIAPTRAQNDVFRLGRVSTTNESRLGVYGIGLKRAVFKMGRRITVSSWHRDGAFKVAITPEWLEDETNWRLPLEELPSRATTGTRILVEDLRPEIAMRVAEGTLLKRLKDALSTTYSLFLDRVVAVRLNGTAIEGNGIPIGRSESVVPGIRTMSHGDVSVRIIAGIRPRRGEEWDIGPAGWYVVCNGRVVVAADQTDLTGWGLTGPQFVSKHRGFVGVAFFFSEKPSLLPWTTTKRGLNRESQVFQRARHEMMSTARPVLTFLGNMYPGDVPSEVVQREVADSVEKTPFYRLKDVGDAGFRWSGAGRTRRTATVSVQYKARKSDIERAKKCLGKPGWSAGRVGRHALQYLIDQECPNE